MLGFISGINYLNLGISTVLSMFLHNFISFKGILGILTISLNNLSITYNCFHVCLKEQVKKMKERKRWGSMSSLMIWISRSKKSFRVKLSECEVMGNRDRNDLGKVVTPEICSKERIIIRTESWPRCLESYRTVMIHIWKADSKQKMGRIMRRIMTEMIEEKRMLRNWK